MIKTIENKDTWIDQCFECGKTIDNNSPEMNNRKGPGCQQIQGTYDVQYYCFGCSKHDSTR